MDFHLSRSLKTGPMVLVVLLLLWVASGCAAEPPSSRPDGPSAEPSPEPGAIGAPQDVSFVTADGVQLSGRAFGSGSVGLVLSHMFPADQSSWYPAAEELAAQGYLVLTFDFRGYGESSGSKEIDLLDLDVDAAVAQLEALGAEQIGLVGASMGGTACLITAAKHPVSAVATLSAPVEFRGLSAEQAVKEITAPKLFIAAEDDVGAQGARDLYAAAQDPKEILIVPGEDHGTNLLLGFAKDEVWDALTAFLKQEVPVGQ